MSLNYVIALVPRSGSTLLQKLLSAHEVFGEPEEYFNTGSFERFVPLEKYPEGEEPTLDEYTRLLPDTCRGSNGVFGVKMPFEQFGNFFRFPSFQNLIGSSRFIFVDRRDILDQAISYMVAAQTNQWYAREDDSQSDSPQLKYSPQIVEQALQHLNWERKNWKLFFQMQAIEPLEIFYEDLVEDTEKCCEQISNYLGVPLKKEIGIGDVSIKKQEDPRKDEIRRLYLKEFTTVLNNHDYEAKGGLEALRSCYRK